MTPLGRGMSFLNLDWYLQGAVAAAGIETPRAGVAAEKALETPCRDDTRPLAGRVALVTGSTSGIGLAMARDFAAAGCHVVLNGFGEADEIKKLEGDLARQYGVKVVYSPADLTKPPAIREMIEAAIRDLGSVDILVNNAGMQHVSPIDEFPEEKWDLVIALNLTAAFHTTKAALPGMKARGFGRIINIASAHGKVASVNKSAYCASKHGLMGLTKVTALETAGTGVTANSICPGWVLTPLVQKQIEARTKTSGKTVAEETAALVSEKHPSGQAARPEHLAQLALFLSSEAAEQITGADFSMDGGWTAR